MIPRELPRSSRCNLRTERWAQSQLRVSRFGYPKEQLHQSGSQSPCRKRRSVTLVARGPCRLPVISVPWVSDYDPNAWPATASSPFPIQDIRKGLPDGRQHPETLVLRSTLLVSYFLVRAAACGCGFADTPTRRHRALCGCGYAALWPSVQILFAFRDRF
jgi:hypothetical protein